MSGKTVTLAQGSGSSTISAASGPSSATGVVTFTVKDTKAEAVTYTATDTTDSITLAQTAKVTFTAGAVSPTVSTVVATPTSVPANGSITLTITVTLLDTNGNPVSGKTVTLAQGSGSSIISAASGPSNVLGAVTFTVKDTKAEAVTYTATDTTDTITITQTATVTFIMVSPTLSTVVASPTSVVADGSTTFDGHGHAAGYERQSGERQGGNVNGGQRQLDDLGRQWPVQCDRRSDLYGEGHESRDSHLHGERHN